MYKLLCVVFLFVLMTACRNDKPGAKSPASAQQKNNDSLPQIVAGLKEDAQKYPDSAALQLQLAAAYDSLRLYDYAITAINNAIKNDSLNNKLWFNKGVYQQNNGDTAGALLSYNRSYNIYADRQTLLYLGNLYALKGDKITLPITKSLRDGVYDAAGSAEVDLITGTYFARTNNVKQAMFYLDKAIGADFKLMDAYIEKGTLLFKNKKYTEAIQVYDVAIEVNPRYADSYYFKAQCMEATGNNAAAIELYETALQFDENFTEAKAALARLK